MKLMTKEAIGVVVIISIGLTAFLFTVSNVHGAIENGLWIYPIALVCIAFGLMGMSYLAFRFDNSKNHVKKG